MRETLDRLPPNIRTRFERALLEAGRTPTAAETQPADVPPSGNGFVFLTISSRASQIAVPTVLSVVADVVDALGAHAETYVWSTTALRVTVEDVITAAARHLFDAYPLRRTPFDAFRTEVVHAARKAPWWSAYQAVLEALAAPATFGQQLEARRKEAGLTVEKLAEAVELTPRAVYKHRDDSDHPTNANREAYARALGARLGRVITFD